MLYYIFTLILTVVAAIVDISGKDKDKDWNIWIYILGMIAGGTLLLGLFSYEPTAMDVYQGKTTLKITYKDGVPMDSVVVFKDKKK
jgi:hypothetical protein